MAEMAGRVLFVTGGASGIGKATALAFAAAGASVAVADLDDVAALEVASEITGAGGDAIAVRCNVVDAVEVEAAVATTVGAFGKIDCAFNNAGIIETPPMSIVECPVELWQKIVDVNLTGVWLSMKYEITQMMKQGLGSIVNTSSIGGLGGIPGLCAYTGTKHGVIGITKTVALECATLGSVSTRCARPRSRRR